LDSFDDDPLEVAPEGGGAGAEALDAWPGFDVFARCSAPALARHLNPADLTPAHAALVTTALAGFFASGSIKEKYGLEYDEFWRRVRLTDDSP
jgi:hypothetical protein